MPIRLNTKQIKIRLKKYKIIFLDKEYKNTLFKHKLQCYCGNIFYATLNHIFSGKTKSCGCFFKQQVSKRSRKNLLGKTFNRWKVIRFVGIKKQKTLWECKCKCGNIKQLTCNQLTTKQSQSCGCLQKEIISKIKYKNIIGFKQKTGKLTVIKHLGSDKNKSNIWLCKCICNQTTKLTTYQIKKEIVKSCGNCLLLKHGRKTSWIALKLHQLLIDNNLRTNLKLHNYNTKCKINIDIALIYNNQKIAIEYCGAKWHKSLNFKRRDKLRFKKLINSNWKILIIRSSRKMPKISTIIKKINNLNKKNIEIITLKDWYS